MSYLFIEGGNGRMNKDTKSNMIQSQTVEKQLNQLEQQNATTEKNKKGSTNEIQPIATDDGLTQ
jgi:hypothetical protein